MKILLSLYAALLHLYPRSFRRHFGADMQLNMRDALRERPAALDRLRFFSAALVDLLRSAVAERLTDTSPPVVPTTGRSSMIESLWQDLAFAARSLRRRPTFVCAVVLTLALGIGANTAVFSVIDAVLLHPLPVRNPGELLSIYEALNEHAAHGNTPYPAFRSMAQRSRAFQRIAGFYTIDVGARIGESAEQLTAGVVSGNYFDLLGVRPSAGRQLTVSDDDVIGAHPVVMLSDALWASAFNRNPAAIGSVIHIGDNPFTIVGVTPANFRGTELDQSPRLWVPITMVTSLGAGSMFSGPHSSFVFTTHNFGWVHMIGRLRSGTTPAQAETELNTMLSDIGRESPGARRALQNSVKSPMNVVPVVQAAALAERATLVRFVTMLLVVVALTLLITCVNVANLIHVRSTERARELAIRAALGAGRARIARQLLLESIMLACGGAVVGTAAAGLVMRLLARFTLPGGISLAGVNLGLDGRVLAFTGALALLTAVLFGLAPAVTASGVSLVAALKSHGSATRRNSRGILVAMQVAMSLVLLIGATLFVRSLRAGLQTDIGFDPTHLAAVSFDPMKHNYDRVRGSQLYDGVIARALQIPGVSAAAVATHVPLGSMLQLAFSLGEGPSPSDPQHETSAMAGLTTISPDYFKVLGVPILAGRGFTNADDGTAGKVAVINEAAAKTFFPNQPAVGGTMHLLGMSYTVVGVVRDTKYQSVQDEHVPVMFAPMKEEPATGGVTLVVRAADRAAAVAGLRQSLRAIDPALPVHDARFVADQIDAVLMPQRFGATLLGIFSIIALCVSAAGIFGVVAFGVAQRSSEIGIRIALGAQAPDVLRLVLRRVALASLAGVVVGVAVTAVASRALERFLVGVTPLDLPAFAIATIVLLSAATIAGWIPARRAVLIDPMVAMKAE